MGENRRYRKRPHDFLNGIIVGASVVAAFCYGPKILRPDPERIYRIDHENIKEWRDWLYERQTNLQRYNTGNGVNEEDDSYSQELQKVLSSYEKNHEVNKGFLKVPCRYCEAERE